MTYKLIVFDLDGTAIPNTPGGMPSDALISAVEQTKTNIHLSAATGRPLTNALPIINAIGLQDLCIISGGTQIYNPLTHQIVWEVAFDQADVAAALEACQGYPYEVLVNNELIGEGLPAKDRTLTDTHINVMYIMGCEPDNAQKILASLSTHENITAAGVLSWTHKGVDIHITNKEATKEHAITEMLRMMNIEKSEVIGVGDADNDIHLFAAVGHKVAMGNATDTLKSLADEVIASVDQDGLATLISRYHS